MRKLRLALLAMVLGIAMTGTAFTVIHQNDDTTVNDEAQEFYWYTPDGLNSLGFGENPNNGCTEAGIGCAKGYEEEQTIPASAPPNATRAKNN